MENENFNLYKFAKDLDKNLPEPDDLTDLQKAQMILTTRLFQTNSLFRLFIMEMTDAFLQSSISEKRMKAFIERADLFLQFEHQVFSKLENKRVS